MVLLVLVILVFGSGVLTYLIRSVNDWDQRRHQTSRRRQEFESRERQLKLLPEIISAYLGVTQDQAKADELSAFLTGMVNGSSSASTIELHRKLDQIIALLETETEEEEEEEGEDEGEDEDEDEDEESPSDRLRLQIEREHTLRVNAVLAHVRETSRPSPQELQALLKTVRPSEGVPSTGVRIDPSATHSPPVNEDVSAEESPAAAPADEKVQAS